MELLDLTNEKIRKVIEERTARLSESEKQKEVLKEDVHLICFLINEEVWAVPISQVKEIFPFSSITKIPNAPRHVIGLSNLRGTVLTLIDIAELIGIGTTDISSNSQVVIIDLKELDVAFVVDRLIDII